MQKLTPAQRDWLIEQFRNKYICHGIHVGDPNMHDVESIINQCTEQKFPEFKIVLCEQKDVEHDQIPDYIEIYPWDDRDPTYAISLYYICPEGEITSIVLHNNKFRELSAKINAVVEWLDKNS